MDLYVRVKPKSGVEKFYRCGMAFTLVWLFVEGIDAATAQRLEEEQMLEVSADTPVDYEGLDATSNADGTASEEPPATADTPAAAPNDPESETASPVDPVVGMTTGEGVIAATGSGAAVQAQAEAEARAQAELEAAAEAATSPAKPAKAKK